MQLKQSEISDNLRSLTSSQIKKLTDEDIYHYLNAEIGLSTGPCVSSTRSLYEKLLIESIEHLDNINEFLANFTKTSDKVQDDFIKLIDSGHGHSMNSIDNASNGSANNSNGSNGSANNSNGTNGNEQIPNDAIETNKQSNVSNRSNVSNTSNQSNKSNVSNKSNASNSSESLIKSTHLNINLKANCSDVAEDPISSPIPFIKVTNVDANFDNKWPNVQLGSKETQRCSTPIERQIMFQANKKPINDYQTAKRSETIQGNLFQNVQSGSTGTIENTLTSNLLKKANLNRNVFKNYNLQQQVTKIDDHQIEPTHRYLEPTFKKAASQSATTHLTNRPLDTLQQFSDQEDNDEGGIELEYKITARPNRRLSGKIPKFTRSDYSRKATVPNYQTNHAPKSNLINTISIFVFALLIFSLVLAFLSYF